MELALQERQDEEMEKAPDRGVNAGNGMADLLHEERMKTSRDGRGITLRAANARMALQILFPGKRGSHFYYIRWHNFSLKRHGSTRYLDFSAILAVRLEHFED